MTDNVVPIGDGRKTPTAPTASGDVYPPPDAPLDVARRLYAETYDHGGLRTLVHHRGVWMRWTGQHWAEQDYAALKSAVYERLGGAVYEKEIKAKGVVVDTEIVPWNPKRTTVADVMEALAAIANLDVNVTTPAFIAAHDDIGHAGQVIACNNGLLSLTTRELHPHTPAFFNVVSVTFGYDADAPNPVAWLKFLDSIWPDDPDSIALLQEWVGYVLTGRTDLQKILLLIGPSRSGKGTISRLVKLLIGHANVIGPTLASLGTNFGLWPWVGKPLAIIADARLGGAPAHVIVERLLSISGEDLLTVDRKNRSHWIGTLPTRIMIASNELPHFNDAAGAIANRFLTLRMKRSFLGAEDAGLDARLAAELPGILNWALDGLARLNSEQRFTVPKASTEATTMLRELASPVATFVRDCCVTGPGHQVERDVLSRAWVVWANAEGIVASNKTRFGRDLNAAVPGLGTINTRVGKARIRVHDGIAMLGAPPAPPEEDAGQDGKENAPLSAPLPAPIFDGPPSGAGNDATKPQVSMGGAGGAPKSAFQSQSETTPCPDCPDGTALKETGKCVPCTTATVPPPVWIVCWFRHNTTPGQWVKPALVKAAGAAAGYTERIIRDAAHRTDLIESSASTGRGSKWRLDPANFHATDGTPA